MISRLLVRKMKAYTGKILDIDLTKGEIKTIPTDMDLARRFIGGAGYACAYLLPKLSKDTDALGPENILMFMTGPLGGTLATSTGRMVVCAKSPYTDIWGESNCGSHVSVQLKKAGYDGVIIKGISPEPTTLIINDDNVELRSAKDLWGKGTWETEEILTSSEDMKRAKVMSIGPAGENLVKYAIITSDERAFGRTGMGAVMGSKKLKAIVVKGTKKVEVAKPDELKEFAVKTNKEFMDITTNVMLQELGTSGSFDMYNYAGELPVGYYRQPMYDEGDDISGSTLAETYLKKNRHCSSCPIGCGRVVEIGENEIGVPKGLFEGPEYETLAGYGSLIMNPDLKAILKANYVCNDLGIDTISSSSTFALLMDLMERGKITADDLDGHEISWGDMDTVFILLEKIAKREGIGDVLAGGSYAVMNKFGIDPEEVAVIRKCEPTYHDMRAIMGQSIAYGISPHYACLIGPRFFIRIFISIFPSTY